MRLQVKLKFSIFRKDGFLTCFISNSKSLIPLWSSMEHVAISNIIQPKLQTSLRSSYGLSKTSGAIQFTLPTVVLFRSSGQCSQIFCEVINFQLQTVPCFSAFIIHKCGNTEVADRNRQIRPQENVRRLEITMNNGLLVNVN